MAQVVAVRTGLSQADADKQVSDVINQARTALENARKAAAKLSMWLTASLLIGAFAASLQPGGDRAAAKVRTKPLSKLLHSDALAIAPQTGGLFVSIPIPAPANIVSAAGSDQSRGQAIQTGD